MIIKVLGASSPDRTSTVTLIEEVAVARGADVTVTVLEELGDLMAYGVMSTPGVVIDGVVMHMGGIPTRERVERWFL